MIGELAVNQSVARRLISLRLDAVDDLMDSPKFSGDFTQLAKHLPDLEVFDSLMHSGPR